MLSAPPSTMNPDAQTERKVKMLVGIQSGRDPDRLYADVDLYGDLGLGGDDVLELLEELYEEFGMYTHAADLAGCFPSEGQCCGCLCFPLGREMYQPSRRCRIAHVIEAASTKRWPPMEVIHDGPTRGEDLFEPQEDPPERQDESFALVQNYAAEQQRRPSPSGTFVLMMWLISLVSRKTDS